MSQVSDIIVNWTPETSGRVVAIQIQSRIIGTGQQWTEQAAAHDPVAGVFRFGANAPATDVEVRTRYRMVSGVFSPWTSASIRTAAVTIPYVDLTGTPSQLSDINSTEGGKLGGIAPGATVGAQFDSNLRNADGTIANSATYSNRNVPIGKNAFVNSSFARGNYGLICPPYPVQINLPGFFGKRNVAYIHITNGFGPGNYVDISSRGWWDNSVAADQRAFSLPVKQGDRIAVRVLVAGHRCAAQLFALVFNKDFQLVQPESTGVIAGIGGANDGDNFQNLEYAMNITHPEAVYVQWMVRAINNGGDDPYLFFSEPYMAKLWPGQVVIPPYEHGPNDPYSDLTSSNVAAGFAGQGALAGLNQVGSYNIAPSSVQRITYEVLRSAINCPINN